MSNESSLTVVDTTELWDRVGGDVDLLKEIIDIYFDETPRLLGQIREAVERRDCKVISRVTHRFKGMVGNLAAEHVFKIAERLEQDARENNLDHVETRLRELENHIALLESELTNLRTAETPCAS